MKEKIIFILTSPDAEQIGKSLYDKSLSYGKWLAILMLCFVALLYFLNRGDKAAEHFKSISKGVFVLVLAPTIIAFLFWIAGSIKI